jgi:hypothetical protein
MANELHELKRMGAAKAGGGRVLRIRFNSLNSFACLFHPFSVSSVDERSASDLF